LTVIPAHFSAWFPCRILYVLFPLETLCLLVFLKGGMSHLLAERDFPLVALLFICNFAVRYKRQHGQQRQQEETEEEG
jgi:hypothetical protein